MIKPFKFFQKEDYFIPRARRGSGRTIAYDLVPIQPLGSRTRECAVIASSIQNFNNWRNETFDRSSVFIITNRDFTHTNGNNNQTTRYTAITTINHCRGYTFDDYISLISTMTLVAGIIFEMPILVYFLTRMGLITPSFMRKYRKHALVIILIAAAIITPSPDVTSQMIVAVPMYLLYEISVFISVWVIKKHKLI